MMMMLGGCGGGIGCWACTASAVAVAHRAALRRAVAGRWRMRRDSTRLYTRVQHKGGSLAAAAPSSSTRSLLLAGDGDLVDHPLDTLGAACETQRFELRR